MKIQSLRSAVALLGVAMFATALSVHAQSVSVTASPTTITNEGETTITLSLSAPASHNITLNFAMTGTATLGSDYVLIGDFNKSAQVFIPVGQSSSMITLHSLFDDDGIRKETAIFNILGGERYRVGFPSRAQVTIENQPQN